MKISNTKNITKLLTILFISALTFTACSEDDDHDDDHDHEEELITTVIYTLINNADSTDTLIATYTDLDGEGGADGVYSVVGTLTTSATYTGSIKLLNATENPAEDITEEVEEEADEHEFFYTNTAGLTITKTDMDGNGNPIGIETSVTAGATDSGTLTVILKHEPTKPNDGSADGAGGSTDVEVTFNVTVQ